MPVDERTIQPFGYLHGGASVALAETVASYGAAQLIDLEKEVCFGLEINANHIRAKQSGQVIATAEVLHQGKSTMVWDVKIRNEEDKLHLCFEMYNCDYAEEMNVMRASLLTPIKSYANN